MEPGAGPRHTYPLSAGLNTLTTPTAKRRAAREKHRKRETVKIAGKADQVNFAPAAWRAGKSPTTAFPTEKYEQAEGSMHHKKHLFQA